MNHFYGQISYADAYKEQMALYERVKSGSVLYALMGLEHPNTLTLGRRVNEAGALIQTREYFEKKGYVIEKTDRGGEATLHMPGQLVIYPIVDLKKIHMGAKDFVCLLLKISKEVLKENGILSETIDGQPGLFVEGKKILFAGLRIKDHISYHGISLNVSNDLQDFAGILSCGQKEALLTSMEQLKQTTFSLESVYSQWLKLFDKKLKNALQ